MNYDAENVAYELEHAAHRSRKMTSRLILHALKLLVLLAVLAAAIGGSFLYGTIKGIVDQSPEAESLTISPLGIASTLYDTDGKAVETLITSGSNRDPVAFSALPQDLIDAFVAIEDERFWTHEGVDIRGVLRSMASLLLSGKINGGASTITQQLIKNNVFNGGAEKGWGARFIRKFQEQYLAIKLEKEVPKEEILISYLNSINLGQNSLGVQVASQRYFGKDVGDLTLSECACIAGITQNPYRYNPIRFPENNELRRLSVLKHMLDQEKITQDEYTEALADTASLYERIAANNLRIRENSSTYSYFTDAVINEVLEDLQTELGLSEADAYTMLYSGGLNIYTTMDSSIQAVLDDEVNDPSNYPADAFQWSFNCQIMTETEEGTKTYNENQIKKEYQLNDLVFSSKDEISALIVQFKKDLAAKGISVIDEKVYYTLQPQLSAIIIDHRSGGVLAVTGGRGEKSVSRALDRAVDTYRSPGSTFKILSTFAPGIDSGDITLADWQYDTPFTYQGYTMRNWWGSNIWFGRCNARMAIVYSMNVVSANFMINRIGIEKAFDTLGEFGFSTLVRSETIGGKVYSDLGPALCLGSLTKGVNLLELTDAFAALANSGTYIEPTFYTKITDHDGNTLLERTQESHRVVEASTAWLLTDAMADSMVEQKAKGTWVSSNSPAAALNDGVPAAGKSGTATDSTGKARDWWFIGYTNYYTMGVWTGFDDGGIPLNGNVTSDNYQKKVWKNVMDRIHAGKAAVPFIQPGNIVSAKICPLCGKLAVTGLCDKDTLNPPYIEYFVMGTEPKEYCDCHVLIRMCSDSKCEAGPWCTKTYTKLYYSIPKTSTTTVDSALIYEYGVTPKTCTKHKEPEKKPEETEEAASPSSEAGENAGGQADGGQ